MNTRLIAIAGVFSLVLASPVVAADETYFALMINGQKVGHAMETRTVHDGHVTHNQSMDISISRGPSTVNARITVKAVNTTEGKPVSFEMVQDIGVVAMKVRGVVTPDGRLDVTTTSMGQSRKKTVPWPTGALLGEGTMLEARKHGLAEGTSYKMLVFDPTSMQAMETAVIVGAHEKIDLLGRSVYLTRLTSTTKGTGGNDLISTQWVDDEYDTLKMTTQMMGFTLEMIACDKAFALSKNQPGDFFTRTLVASPRPLDKRELSDPITYRVASIDGSGLKLIETDSQAVRPGSDSTIKVTVSPQPMPPGLDMPYQGNDETLQASIKANEYLQSDHETIIELAREAVGSSNKAGVAAKKIENFVSNYITNKNLSVGYATAVEVAHTREGDCTEHSLLAAAMCRSLGIPARVVTGLAYVPRFVGNKDIFGPHMWVQVNVDGRWIDIDPTLGFDSGHIAMSTGDGGPGQFFDLISTLGNIKIENIGGSSIDRQ